MRQKQKIVHVWSATYHESSRTQPKFGMGRGVEKMSTSDVRGCTTRKRQFLQSSTNFTHKEFVSIASLIISSVLVAPSLHLLSTLASRKAEFFLLFSSICLLTVSLSLFAPLSLVCPSPPLTPSVTSCQLYADDLVVLSASQTDLQLALDAVHGLGWFAGASPLVLVAPNPPPWSSVLCAAALTDVFTFVAFPCS